MKYTKEDRKFIESLLNKCITIKEYNSIYYVTSPNILRQLKYNRLYSKNKEVNVDLDKLKYDENIILKQKLKNKEFLVNYYKIWSVFHSKYNCNYFETNDILNKILCDILKVKQYTTDFEQFVDNG